MSHRPNLAAALPIQSSLKEQTLRENSFYIQLSSKGERISAFKIKTFLVANVKVGLEANTEKTWYMFMSRKYCRKN